MNLHNELVLQKNIFVPFVAIVAIAVAFVVAARAFAVLAIVAVTGFAPVEFGALVAVNDVKAVVLQNVALAISTGRTVLLGQGGFNQRYQ
jgi:hypothetical protein